MVTCSVRIFWLDNDQLPIDPLLHGDNELLEVIFDEVLEEAHCDTGDFFVQRPA